jgi:Na+:H+ antiporter, NhaA family
MADEAPASKAAAFKLQRAVEPARDHIRGGKPEEKDVVSVLLYGDFLCPYCRRLRPILIRLRQALGERMAYIFRHYPNETAHPGATFMACAAEAAGKQGRFWEFYDRLYGQQNPLSEKDARGHAEALGLDMPQFERDLESETARDRVEEDLSGAKRNGVTGTPTLFIDGQRYDGAWDFYSLLEAIERPVAVQVQRSARVFASLPASGGLILILAAAAALVCANTSLAPYYRIFIESSFNIGPPGRALSLTVGDWFSEGLLAFFFLLVGLEIRREMTVGILADLRAALLPIIAAVGGVLAPAAVYLALNRGPTAPGWSVPTATDIAFALGILALLGNRIPVGLRVFIAALAVVDDILSMLTLAIFYPQAFTVEWLLASAMALVLLFILNRGRVYVGWPYVLVTIALWLSLHAAGVHGALAGVLLAAFLPTRPTPAAGPLLAQAATALAELEHAESELKSEGDETRGLEQEPIWDWASRNLSAASHRLLSPADRFERAIAPWSTHLILPLFAFSATGIALSVDLSSPGATIVFAGVILGLVIGKPLGVCLASLLAIKTRIGLAPDGVGLRQFIGGACLCGIGDTVALLMADQAFPDGSYSAIAKIGVLIGSILAAILGAVILLIGPKAAAMTPVSES